MAFDTADLDAHDGIFAVTREEWEESPAFDAQVKERMDHQQEREQAFLDHKGDCFAIYQVKHTDELRDIRYEGWNGSSPSGRRCSGTIMIWSTPRRWPRRPERQRAGQS